MPLGGGDQGRPDPPARARARLRARPARAGARAAADLEEARLLRPRPGTWYRGMAAGDRLGLRRADPCRGAKDRLLLERHDDQLRRWAAEERADEEELVEVARFRRRERTPCGREPRLDLEMRAASRRQRALGRDASARDEERARMARLRRRDDEAALHRAQSLQPLELAAHALERVDTVAQPRRVFVAARVRQLAEPPAQARER